MPSDWTCDTEITSIIDTSDHCRIPLFEGNPNLKHKLMEGALENKEEICMMEILQNRTDGNKQEQFKPIIDINSSVNYLHMRNSH